MDFIKSDPDECPPCGEYVTEDGERFDIVLDGDEEPGISCPPGSGELMSWQYCVDDGHFASYADATRDPMTAGPPKVYRVRWSYETKLSQRIRYVRAHLQDDLAFLSVDPTASPRSRRSAPRHNGCRLRKGITSMNVPIVEDIDEHSVIQIEDAIMALPFHGDAVILTPGGRKFRLCDILNAIRDAGIALPEASQ